MIATRAGTTLIELVVVLLLVGLLMGLVVPALTAVRHSAPGSATMDSIRLAAVRRGQPVARPATDSVTAFFALPDGRIVGGEHDSAR